MGWASQPGPPVSSGASASFVLAVSGSLMILVGLIYVIGWKLLSGRALRWFWAGAGIWAVGVALKLLFAIALNKPILAGLEQALPRVSYLVVGALYLGLLTGIFEIGFTLAAARRWSSLSRDGETAVAVGVGAGAFEAVLLGLAALVSILALMSGTKEGEMARAALASSAASTPLIWLTGPVERVLAILCHTSSRTLVLLSAARKRSSFFWYGFALLTALDGTAGFFHLAEKVGRISSWWIELLILPFAIVSVPIIIWCLRHWPPVVTDGEGLADTMSAAAGL